MVYARPLGVTWFTRAAGVVTAAAVTTTGTVAAFAAVGNGLLHDTASAVEMPLPPLGSTIQEGSTVFAADGKTVLSVLSGPEFRVPVALSRVSKVAVKAVLDTEDHRFYIHGGFDIPSTIRALAADSSAGGGLQGGSTITQQLVKQLYLTSQRTITRKIKEAVIADRLERRYTKDEILDAYLNTIYFGNGAYGIEAAAHLYFGVHASALDLPDSALLAGMIQDPAGYDPILQPEAARDRRTTVLAHMEHYGDITSAQDAAADRMPLPTTLIRPPTAGDHITNYYVEQVKNQLLADGSPLGSTYQQRYQALFEGGLKIYTNLDPNLQSLAETTIARDTPPNSRGFQEAMVVIDPASGRVRAMVGGTGVNYSDYDVVTDGQRQPGSGFKIFTLLAALERGYSIYDTLDGDSPCAIRFPGDADLVAHPAKNDEGPGGGIMTLLDATARSVNCAYIRLGHEVGLENIISMARRLGVTAALNPYPSMIIGSIPVRPIEMASAYATLADDGVYHAPSFVDRVIDRSGSTIYAAKVTAKRVLAPEIAREATAAFQQVVQGGTGTAAQLGGRPVAGKTGTTDSNADAWFNGYTPQLEATVWMGNVSADVPMLDVGGVPAVYGGTFPAITWRDFMASALADQPVLAFPPLDPALLPPPRYITSPSLVADDVIDHNFGYFGFGPSPLNPAPQAPAPTRKRHH
jgi:penicillin-binding protein 1A